MRICHMWAGAGKIKFGIYACSPEDSKMKRNLVRQMEASLYTLRLPGNLLEDKLAKDAEQQETKTDSVN